MKQKEKLIIQRGVSWDGIEVNTVFIGNHPVASVQDRTLALKIYCAVSAKQKEMDAEAHNG